MTDEVEAWAKLCIAVIKIHRGPQAFATPTQVELETAVDLAVEIVRLTGGGAENIEARAVELVQDFIGRAGAK